MASRRVNLVWPMGGQSERAGYQSQPPFTTPDAMNVRPVDTAENRLRGGSRPGLTKAYRNQMGNQDSRQVRMLANVERIVPLKNRFELWADPFDGVHMSDAWKAIPTYKDPNTHEPILRPLLENTGAAYSTMFDRPPGSNLWRAAVRKPFDDFDLGGTYRIVMKVFPDIGTDHGYNGFFDIFFRGAEDRLISDSLMFRWEMRPYRTQIPHKGILYRWSNSRMSVVQDVFTRVVNVETGGGELTVVVKHQDEDVDRIQIWWNDPSLDNEDPPGPWALLPGGEDGIIWPHAESPGQRIGFGMFTEDDRRAEFFVNRMNVLDFSVDYSSTELEARQTTQLLCAIAGGQFHRESEDRRNMDGLETQFQFPISHSLQAADHSQRLFIADYGPPKFSGVDGRLDHGGTDGSVRLFAESVPRWIGQGVPAIYTEGDLCELSDANPPAKNGIFRITNIDPEGRFIDLQEDAMDGSGEGGAAFRVLPGPKVYDPAEDTVKLWEATQLQVPVNCPLIARFQGRIVLAGEESLPGVWYMSRQGDPFDWHFFAGTNVGRAVVSTNAEAGDVGEAIKAVIPHTDDYLVFGCSNSLWILRGNPNTSGILDIISDTIGVVGKFAWTKSTAIGTIFLSRDGLYVLAPGGGGYPRTLSTSRLPRRLMDIDEDRFSVVLEYDMRDRGVHIFVVREGGSTQGLHYWYDLATDSFWPVQMRAGIEPMVMLLHKSQRAEDSSVVLGGRDGYLRKFSDRSFWDDGLPFSNHCLIGPIRMGPEGSDGVLSELEAIMPLRSSVVSWEAYVGSSAEEAILNEPVASGKWSKLRSFRSHPRVRGSAMFLKLNGLGFPWSFETASAKLVQAGRTRVMR